MNVEVFGESIKNLDFFSVEGDGDYILLLPAMVLYLTIFGDYFFETFSKNHPRSKSNKGFTGNDREFRLTIYIYIYTYSRASIFRMLLVVFHKQYLVYFFSGPALTQEVALGTLLLDVLRSLD